MSKSEKDDPEEIALYAAVARRIRSARLNGNLTQQELADRIQAKRSYIFELESGSANPTLRTLYRLGKAFSLAPAELLPDAVRPQLDHDNMRRLTEHCDAILSSLSRHHEEDRNAILAFRQALQRLAPSVDDAGAADGCGPKAAGALEPSGKAKTVTEPSVNDKTGNNGLD